MGIQIVTGYTGTAHIKSAHDRTRNAGVVGTGSYVLKVGNQLAARMQSANTLRIVDGDLMMQGVHATIEAGTHEDLTVENGTQGMKRNDIVVARYERLSGEPKTESVKLKVIKGAPSASEPEDPKHAEGDILKGDLVAEMPLYRVPIDGIAPGTPVPLFETVPTIDELRDSVSQGRHPQGRPRRGDATLPRAHRRHRTRDASPPLRDRADDRRAPGFRIPYNYDRGDGHQDG